jgi:hypothetical protein
MRTVSSADETFVGRFIVVQYDTSACDQAAAEDLALAAPLLKLFA